MRVLITGASGFVGQHLAQLLEKRNEVWGTFLQPPSEALPVQTKFVRCDVTDPGQLRELIGAVRPQQIYHLAAFSSVKDSFSDAKAVYDVNFMGTLNLLEQTRALQPSARILLVSSGQCYGRVRQSEVPVRETQCISPNNPYAVSKAASEMLATQFFCCDNLQVIRVRPFNHTGPGQSSGFVCSNWAKQFAEIELQLRPPTLLVGDLTMRRDFSDVRDVVRAYALLLRNGKAGDVYNVGTGRAISLRAVLTALQSLCSCRVSVRVDPKRLRPSEVKTIFPDTRKLRRATNWKPRFEIATTLQDLLDYWRQVLRLQRARG